MIVLEAPNTAPTGTHKYRCMICTLFWRISDASYETVRQMKRDHTMYVVVCHGCFQELDPLLPDDMRGGRLGTTIQGARQYLGYR